MMCVTRQTYDIPISQFKYCIGRGGGINMVSYNVTVKAKSRRDHVTSHQSGEESFLQVARWVGWATGEYVLSLYMLPFVMYIRSRHLWLVLEVETYTLLEVNWLKKIEDTAASNLTLKDSINWIYKYYQYKYTHMYSCLSKTVEISEWKPAYRVGCNRTKWSIFFFVSLDFVYILDFHITSFTADFCIARDVLTITLFGMQDYMPLSQ